VIIEANMDVYRHLEEFSREAVGRVTPIGGFWQDVVPRLADGEFDGILFDTYPLSADEIHANHFPFFEHAHRLLRPGGVLTYYSDEVSCLSPEHLRALSNAGFSRIGYSVFDVTPPSDCRYWRSSTIVAPRIYR
jgi:guanidinoacetate N-methyltransferase